MTHATAFEQFRERARASSLASLPASLARMRWSAGQLAEHQRSRLRSLLRHAAARSKFYARRLRGLDLEQ
jgi:phenylacetate-coenzyme A ligase PaaK-like adenylate-forming protein